MIPSKGNGMNSEKQSFKGVVALSTLLLFGATADTLSAQQQIPARDKKEVANRGDVRLLPAPLKNRLIELAGRPHTYLPATAFSEAADPSQLVTYYLLDTEGFQPNRSLCKPTRLTTW